MNGKNDPRMVQLGINPNKTQKPPNKPRVSLVFRHPHYTLVGCGLSVGLLDRAQSLVFSRMRVLVLDTSSRSLLISSRTACLSSPRTRINSVVFEAISVADSRSFVVKSRIFLHGSSGFCFPRSLSASMIRSSIPNFSRSWATWSSATTTSEFVDSSAILSITSTSCWTTGSITTSCPWTTVSQLTAQNATSTLAGKKTRIILRVQFTKSSQNVVRTRLPNGSDLWKLCTA